MQEPFFKKHNVNGAPWSCKTAAMAIPWSGFSFVHCCIPKAPMLGTTQTYNTGWMTKNNLTILYPQLTNFPMFSFKTYLSIPFRFLLSTYFPCPGPCLFHFISWFLSSPPPFLVNHYTAWPLWHWPPRLTPL